MVKVRILGGLAALLVAGCAGLGVAPRAASAGALGTYIDPCAARPCVYSYVNEDESGPTLIEVSGRGFVPGADVQIVMPSLPNLEGRTRADATGFVQYEIDLHGSAATISEETHKLEIGGTDAQLFARDLSDGQVTDQTTAMALSCGGG
jgi:hypothetical protein